MTPSTVRILEIGPELVPLATRLIGDSLLVHYPKFMGAGRLHSHGGLGKYGWLGKETLTCTTSPRGHAFVVFKNSLCVAAMTTIWHFRSLEIMSLFVLPGFTSDGIGAQLFKIAKQDARKRGMRLKLNVLAANSRARKFYEQQGGILTQRRQSGWGPLVVYGWEKP